jgi:dUTP pyrophosphatase
MDINVPFTFRPVTPEIPEPKYETDTAAGFDLPANIYNTFTLCPGQRAVIETGLSFAIPDGYEIQVRPRSGLAAKKGITVLNSPGTIDSDYRGVVGVILFNAGSEPFDIEPGMRIAQAVLCPVFRAVLDERTFLPETKRGAGGFGSTGV